MSRFWLDQIPHSRELAGIKGPFSADNYTKNTRTLAERERDHNKIVPSIEEVVKLCGLKDGMTISFHHHFRGGDYIVNMVLDVLAKMGFKNLTVAASSLTNCHAPMIEHIKSGLVSKIQTSGLRGKLAEAVSHGLMEIPVVFRSHGGRAGAIDNGEIHIDVAFLGAPSCDPYGNANGYIRDEANGIMCGSLGYAKTDSESADKTVIITNNIVHYPNTPFAIPEDDVDYIVKVEEIGDPAGIMTGATRFTSNPKELLIAEQVAKVIVASGRFQDGFSFQTGTGGASLAVTRYLESLMRARNIQASYALGGITGSIVELHEQGLVKKLLDVQSFDMRAAASLRDNRFHQQISASYYASPYNEGTAVNQLDVVVLSALEVDCDFNVNVLTGSDGVIRGAIGGHPDTAYGASVSIIVVPLTRGRIPCVVKEVGTIVTPGKTVDVIVTEQGIAVNPKRVNLTKRIKESGLPIVSIEELQQKAEKLVGAPKPIKYTDKVVGIVTYRDGTVIDVVQQVVD